jgi:hypothetical protein
VPPGIPSQRRYPITKPQAVAFEPLRHAERAFADFGVIGRVHRPFNGSRDYGPRAGIYGGVINDAMAQKRPVLHQAKHWLPPFRCTTSRSCMDRLRLRGNGRNTPKLI